MNPFNFKYNVFEDGFGYAAATTLWSCASLSCQE